MRILNALHHISPNISAVVDWEDARVHGFHEGRMRFFSPYFFSDPLTFSSCQVKDSCAEASTCSLNIALFKAMEAARATNR